MKTNLQKELTRWGVIAALGALLIGFTQCVGTESGPSSSSEASSYNSGGLTPAPEEEAPEVGVKDADRIYQTMSVLTGVPANNGTVLGIYNSDYKAQLPVNSRVEAMLETHMLGAAKLASEFCNVLINDGTLRAAIWPTTDFNFGSNASVVFAPNSVPRGRFIVLMLERFWGVGVLESTEYEDGYDAIDQLITDVMQGQTANQALTITVAKTACTSALSSPQVLLQ